MLQEKLLFKCYYWGLNSEPCACWISSLPLTHMLNRNLLSHLYLLIQISNLEVLHFKQINKLPFSITVHLCCS